MITIRSLAAELGVQEYQLADFLGLGADYDPTAELDPAEETLYREAWAVGEEASSAE